MKKLIVLLVFTSGLLLTSCYQDPKNGAASITILYNGYRQSGVDVHLYGPAGSYIDLHKTTNVNGEVIYEHDPTLEVVLEMHATYTDPANVFHDVYGIVRITPDKVTNLTFNL